MYAVWSDTIGENVFFIIYAMYVVVISCEIGSKEEAMNNMPPSSQGSQINNEQDFGVRCPCGCNEVDMTH